MLSKADFIGSLQGENKALSPYDISQRLRIAVGCVCVYRGDPDLSVDDFRGYMIKYADKPHRSPENPELYVCVISLQQSKAWQDVIWTKEILQILDSLDHRTDTQDKLGQMLEHRRPHAPYGDGTPTHIVADANGFTLALGCTVPQSYRDTLRQQRYLDRYPLDVLEGMLLIPAEWVEFVLSPSFEDNFNLALASCA
jgi:hypothetical protein